MHQQAGGGSCLPRHWEPATTPLPNSRAVPPLNSEARRRRRPAFLQVFNVCTSPIVQQAWDAGQPLAVHGLVYALTDGILKARHCCCLCCCCRSAPGAAAGGGPAAGAAVPVPLLRLLLLPLYSAPASAAAAAVFCGLVLPGTCRGACCRMPRAAVTASPAALLAHRLAVAPPRHRPSVCRRTASTHTPPPSPAPARPPVPPCSSSRRPSPAWRTLRSFPTSTSWTACATSASRCSTTFLSSGRRSSEAGGC